MLGNVVLDVGTPRNGELVDDQTDGQSRGDASPTKARRTAVRKPPITDKGKGRNLKIPDSVFRRLELEALRQGTDKSKLATKLLHQALPLNIKMSFVVDNAPTPEDDKPRQPTDQAD